MSRNPHVNMCHRPKGESESGKERGKAGIQSCQATHMCHRPNLNFVAIDPDLGMQGGQKALRP